jgi:hypothetical protein
MKLWDMGSGEKSMWGMERVGMEQLGWLKWLPVQR